jgi:hypothetical protein
MLTPLTHIPTGRKAAKATGPTDSASLVACPNEAVQETKEASI